MNFGRKSSKLFFTLVNVIGEIFEKIVVEQVADFKEKVGVNPVAIEDFVDVLAREIELFGKPGDAATLVAELHFNKVSYVWFFCHAVAFVSFGWGKQKGRNLCVYLKLKARQSP